MPLARANSEDLHAAAQRLKDKYCCTTPEEEPDITIPLWRVHVQVSVKTLYRQMFTFPTQVGQEAAIVKFCQDRDEDRQKRLHARRLHNIYERSAYSAGSIYAEASKFSDVV